MSHIAFRCTACAARHSADMETLWCRECGTPLEVEYLQATGGDTAALAAGSAVPLPLHEVSSAGTLGEGETPCVDLSAVRGALGLQRLWGKLEYLNNRTLAWVQYTVSVPCPTPTYGSAHMC